MWHNVTLHSIIKNKTNQTAYLGFTVLGVADGGVGNTIFRISLQRRQHNGCSVTETTASSFFNRSLSDFWFYNPHVASTSLFFFIAHSHALKTLTVCINILEKKTPISVSVWSHHVQPGFCSRLSHCRVWGQPLDKKHVTVKLVHMLSGHNTSNIHQSGITT